MTQLLLDTATGQVLGYGVLTPGVGQRIVEYAGDLAVFTTPGRKVYKNDGTITVTPPTATDLATNPPAAVKVAWQTLSTAATTDQTMQAIKVLFRYINSQLT